MYYNHCTKLRREPFVSNHVVLSNKINMSEGGEATHIVEQTNSKLVEQQQQCYQPPQSSMNGEDEKPYYMNKE